MFLWRHVALWSISLVVVFWKRETVAMADIAVVVVEWKLVVVDWRSVMLAMLGQWKSERTIQPARRRRRAGRFWSWWLLSWFLFCFQLSGKRS